MNNNKFYTCRWDAVFKEVFWKENNKDILICLLESILNVKIFEINYLNSERLVDNVNVRRKQFDLNLKTNIGYIQVEVSANEGYIYPRNMAYICDTYSHYVLRGEKYLENTKVIQINFSYGVKDSELYRKFVMQDNNGKIFVNNFIIYEFYMDNFSKLWYSKNQENIEKNKYIIMLDLKLNELDILSNGDKVVKKYMNEVEKINEDPEFREYMSAEEDNRKIENTIKYEAYMEGVENGLEKGRIDGAKQETKRIILSLIKNGVDYESISKYLGLSVDEIKNVENDKNI